MKDQDMQYRIVCLQGAGFSSWEEPHTIQEVIEKFWDYAYTEGMFDYCEGDRLHVEKYYDEKGNSLIPDWFDIPFIQDIWEVEIVKYDEPSKVTLADIASPTPSKEARKVLEKAIDDSMKAQNKLRKESKV